MKKKHTIATLGLYLTLFSSCGGPDAICATGTEACAATLDAFCGRVSTCCVDPRAKCLGTTVGACKAAAMLEGLDCSDEKYRSLTCVDPAACVDYLDAAPCADLLGGTLGVPKACRDTF